jgi:hypothetical protein
MGTYTSDELDAVMTSCSATASLPGGVGHTPSSRCACISRASAPGGFGSLRFSRDAGGKVTGFSILPVECDVRFIGVGRP